MTYRALIAKAGLDAHERGVHVITRGLRDAGFEVIMAGLRTPPRAVTSIAVQEDVDVIGISSLAGGHRSFAARLGAALAEADISPVVVFGGVIPEKDDDFLRENGVDAVFRPGTAMAEISRAITELCDRKAVPSHEGEIR